MTDTEQIAATLFGDDDNQALYRALWLFLADCGYDDPVMNDPDWFRRYYDWGGYPHSLLRLDPVAYPEIVSILRDVYQQPDADWDTLQAFIRDDPDSQTLWDAVTGHTFWVYR